MGVTNWSRNPDDNGLIDPLIPATDAVAARSIVRGQRGIMAAVKRLADDQSGALVSAGSANNYVVRTFSGVTAPQAGLALSFVPDRANSGPSSLVVDGLGSYPLVDRDGGDLPAGALKPGRLARVAFDGTAWRATDLGVVGNADLAEAPPGTIKGNDGSGVTDIPADSARILLNVDRLPNKTEQEMVADGAISEALATKATGDDVSAIVAPIVVRTEAAEGDIVELNDQLAAVLAAQGGGFIGAKTWNDLKTLTSTVVGALAEVPVSDTGTHTDPVTGALNTPNSGIFSWSQSPPGWGRLRANEITALSVEVDASKVRIGSLETIVSPSPRSGLTFVDALGMILREETMSEVSMFGRRLKVSRTTDGYYRLTDNFGLIAFEIGGGKVKAYGRELSTGAGLSLADITTAQPKVAASISHIYSKGSRQYAGARKAKARAQAGSPSFTPGAPKTVACIADSNGAGLNNVAVGTHRRAGTWPALAATMLDKTFGANSAAVMGAALNTGLIGSYTTYDPRVIVNAGVSIDAALVSLGGFAFNVSSTGVFTFNPGVIWDTAVVVTAQSAAANMTFDIGGATTALTPALGSIQKTTLTAARGANTLNIRGVSGDGKVVGLYVYDSTKPQILMLNAGRSGWRSDEYAAVASFYSPANAITALAADVVLIMLGLNDFNQSRSPADYKTSMQTIIASSRAGGSDVVLMSSMTPSQTGQLYPWPEYVAKLYELADENDIPLLDVTGRFGSRAAVEAKGWANDDLHPTVLGHADIGAFVSQFINSI